MAFAIILIVFIIGLIFGIRHRLKIRGRNKAKFDDTTFRQAGVEVVFATGKIKIKDTVYDVQQVTGIRAETFGRNVYGGESNHRWRAVIEVDDFAMPRHYMEFASHTRASEFTQRLSTAIRKAGGPSFI